MGYISKAIWAIQLKTLQSEEDAVEQLIGHVRERASGNDAVVVAGDFNTSKDQLNLAGDRTLFKMEEGGFFWSFEGVPFADRITIPRKGSYPDACFDHIYVKGVGRPIARVFADTPGSDHYPVSIDLIVVQDPNEVGQIE